MARMTLRMIYPWVWSDLFSEVRKTCSTSFFRPDLWVSITWAPPANTAAHPFIRLSSPPGSLPHPPCPHLLQTTHLVALQHPWGRL